MSRRLLFFSSAGLLAALLLAGLVTAGRLAGRTTEAGLKGSQSVLPTNSPAPITLFMTGDVMTGRGIDQILPHPVDPQLYEPFVKSAQVYVELAERANGPIPDPVDYAYVWGDALAELERVQPDVRMINLETSITTSGAAWPLKGIHYRMHPQNSPVLTSAGIDYVSLANNHVLDWGYAGLAETLATLDQARIDYAGAGQNLQAAAAPAVLAVAGKGRVIVFSYGLVNSGILPGWAAAAGRPGVNLLPGLSAQTAQQVAARVAAVKQPGDIVVASIHWGDNWGYEIPEEQIDFAHRLIDEAGVDAIHGHSAHHVKGIEVYRQKPVLYGAGDFLNDYEGIGGHEQFRPDLTLMYFVTMDPATGRLVELQMTPLRIEQFRLQRASGADAAWLSAVLTREGQPLGTAAELNADNTLVLRWD